MSSFQFSNENTSQENMDLGTTAFLYSNSLPISFQTKILQHDENHIRLKNNIPYDYILDFNDGSSFELNTGFKKYSTNKVQSDGENIIFPTNDAKNVAETREDPRTYFEGGDKIYCIIVNPYDNLTKIKKPIIDISEGGFGLTTDYDSRLFEPKTTFTDCIIYSDNKKYVKCSCEVVYKQKYHSLKNQTSLQVGFKYLEKIQYG